MTLTPNKPETGQPTATLPIPETDQEFNWRNCWYPVTLLQDLPKDRPYGFSLYDEPLVLFRNSQGKLVCLTDRCPHRAAKLSDGQIIDGKIECLYHGWQFGAEGQCLHIPQLATDIKIPLNSCVKSFAVVEKQGIVWIWPGEAEAADQQPIPAIPDLDKPEFVSTDLVRDLPYDQTYFIENVLDPAHVNISHHPTQGNRDNAQPLEMEVLEHSGDGIRGRWRETRKPNANWVTVDFVAPNFVIHKFKFGSEQKSMSGGLALYSIPLGKGRCRILARNYRNFFTWTIKLTPRWMDHWYRNQILEEDLQLIVGQEEQIERLGQSLKKVYLPLKTCDLFVIEYRKWLDKFGSALPFYQGYSTSKQPREATENNPPPATLNRLQQHTVICSSCNRAYQITNRLKQTFVAVAIALAALAILTDSSLTQLVAVSGSLFALGIAAVAKKIKTKFEHSYTRR